MSAAMLELARRELRRERPDGGGPLDYDAVRRMGSVAAFRVDDRMLTAFGIGSLEEVMGGCGKGSCATRGQASAPFLASGRSRGASERDTQGALGGGLGSGSGDSTTGNPACGSCDSSCNCSEVLESAQASVSGFPNCQPCEVLACFPSDKPDKCECIARCAVLYDQQGDAGLLGCFGQVFPVGPFPSCPAAGGKNEEPCEDNDGCQGSQPPDLGVGSLNLPTASAVSTYAENLDIFVGPYCRGAGHYGPEEYKDAIKRAWALLRANLDLAEYAACIVAGTEAAACLTSIIEGEIIKIQVAEVTPRGGLYAPGWSPSLKKPDLRNPYREIPLNYGGMSYGQPPINLSCLRGSQLSDAVNEAGSGSQYAADGAVAAVLMHEVLHLCVYVMVDESSCDAPSRAGALFKRLLEARLASAGVG